MGSLSNVATDEDIRMINSETVIRCMAKYHYIFKRKKKGNNNGHHRAVRNGYEISKEEEKMGIKYDIEQGWWVL